ncbi:glutamate:gamma-aminobutyrate antiporter [Fructilactobacillus lindneri]|nr:glutamate:gamma-aminobutyrate antiporter [Fructilactobacillus lindneri]ANZ59143.1 glutamate:gamma-aminobutyrate antiporter [Fructilactobacillus lindneri]POH01689.1 glutamate:gamma-aminobutyrate antiporter [Fructilactobacillus lindneri]POH03532.1 glutamate:gamma-aminobutyrate antiporter [Fructilactobacillus lindneri]POH06894.1 glutamate:gamma-aminobutyrate antiporter [Fructilactobacillus lindneri]
MNTSQSNSNLPKSSDELRNRTPVHYLSFFGFLSMTISMVVALYEYPTFATAGLSLVFFLLLGGFLWFIPVALCAAEFATIPGWETGGVYTWVSGTLGRRWGFAAIFFQWFEITVGYLTMLYFLTGALSYVTGISAIQNNKYVKLVTLLVIFWGVLLTQLRGSRYTATIAKIGFAVGILLPAIVLFGLGFHYVLAGGQIHTPISLHALIPDFSKLSTLVVFVSFILAYMGVETSASHANALKNPRKEYPTAMFVLVILAIILDTLGGLTVAVTIPQKGLSLNTGVLQSFDILLSNINPGLVWIARIIALLICLGVIGEIASWVTSPSKALHVAAVDGLLPKYFRYENKEQVPVHLVVANGIVATIWAVVFTLSGGGSNLAFLIALSLTVVIYLMLYFLFFIGYLKMVINDALHKNDHSKKQRSYEVPGRIVGKVLVSGVGLLTSIFAFVISFVPPASIAANQHGIYEVSLVISFLIVLSIPFTIYAFRKHFN